MHIDIDVDIDKDIDIDWIESALKTKRDGRERSVDDSRTKR